VFRPDLDLDEVAVILQDIMIATYLFHDRGPNKEERLARRLATGYDVLMNGIHATVRKDDAAQKDTQVRA
jgi:plasmid stabilization system protein ParE